MSLTAEQCATITTAYDKAAADFLDHPGAEERVSRKSLVPATMPLVIRLRRFDFHVDIPVEFTLLSSVTGSVTISQLVDSVVRCALHPAHPGVESIEAQKTSEEEMDQTAKHLIRQSLTRIGELAAHPAAFGVLLIYASLWFIFDRTTLDWHVF